MPHVFLDFWSLFRAGLLSLGLRRRRKATDAPVGRTCAVVDFHAWATSIMVDTKVSDRADPQRATIDDLTTPTLAAVVAVLETRYPAATVDGPVSGGVNVDTLMFDAGKHAVAKDFRAALEERKRRGG